MRLLSERERKEAKLINKQLKEDIKQLTKENELLCEQVLKLDLACVTQRSELLIKFLTWYENEGRERYAECTHFSVVNEFNKI